MPINRNLIDYWAIYLSDIDQIIYFHLDGMKDKRELPSMINH